MATRYIRARVLVEDSLASDYSRAREHSASQTATGTETVTELSVSATTGGESVELAYLTAANELLIENTDSSIIVTVAYDTNAAATQTQTLAGGAWFKITDWKPATALTLTSASGTPVVKITAW